MQCVLACKCEAVNFHENWHVVVSDLEHVANDEIRVLWNVEGMFVQDLSGDPMTVKICPH